MAYIYDKQDLILRIEQFFRYSNIEKNNDDDDMEMASILEADLYSSLKNESHRDILSDLLDDYEQYYDQLSNMDNSIGKHIQQAIAYKELWNSLLPHFALIFILLCILLGFGVTWEQNWSDAWWMKIVVGGCFGCMAIWCTMLVRIELWLREGRKMREEYIQQVNNAPTVPALVQTFLHGLEN